MSEPSPIFPVQPTIPNALFLSLYSQFIQSRLESEVANRDEKKTTKLDVQKPQHSYIGLIAKAILSTKDKQMLLSEIYAWITENYSYFKYRGTGWRNSVRHNLSLNECFLKKSRASNGKGHYWSIHPANYADFARGDFRRKHAQWRIKSHDLQFTIQAHEQNVRQFLNQVEPTQKRPNNFSVDSLLMEPNDEATKQMPKLSPEPSS